MATEDDFFSLTGGELGDCNDQGSLLKHSYVLPIGAALSCLCYLYIFYLSYVMKSPILKLHPTHITNYLFAGLALVVYRCLFELIFIQQYLWLPFIDSSYFYESAALAAGNCRGTQLAGFLAFISQFTLLGGEIWLLTLSLDLRTAYTNPFSSYKQNKKFYSFLVYSVSIITSVVLILFGPTEYGPSPEGAIWIQNRRDEFNTSHPNVPKIVLFYMWIVIVYFYSFYSTIILATKLKTGFAETLNAKLSIILRARKYVIGYTLYWGLVLIFELISYLATKRHNVYRYFSTVVAYLLCFRGIYTLGLILFTNFEYLSWGLLSPFRTSFRKNLVENVVKEGLLLKPHLNTALRTEILYFTTQGIMFAAQESSNFLERLERSLDIEASDEKAVSSVPFAPTENNQQDKKQSSLPAAVERMSLRLTNFTKPTIAENVSTFAFGEIKDSLKEKGPASALSLNSNNEGSFNFKSSGNGSTLNIANIIQISEAQALAVEEEKFFEEKDEAERLGLLEHFGKNPIPDQASEPQPTFRESLLARLNGNDPKNRSSTGRSFKLSDLESNHEFELPIVHRPSHNSNFGDKANAKRSTQSSQLEPNSLEKSLARESQESERSMGSSTTQKWRTTSNINPASPEEKISSMDSDLGPRCPITKRRLRTIVTDFNSVTEDSSNSRFNIRSISSAVNSVFSTASAFFLNPEQDEFRFKDYNALQFARIRKMCGISPEEYRNAFMKTTKESFSEGRSGAFLFLSSDEKYIVKGTTKDEILVLQRILNRYEEHLRLNPHSLLVRFLGAHCITMYGQDLNFVVFANIYPQVKLSERYDMKGSWINRHRVTKKQNNKGKSIGTRDKSKDSSAPLLFDNDVQQKITLLPEVAKSLTAQIISDVAFLRDQGLMDYSLLVGVKRQRFEVIKKSANSASPTESCNLSSDAIFNNLTDSSGNPFQRRDDGGVCASYVEGPGTFYFGIIDVLQEWNLKKKIERIFKVYFRHLDGDGLSAIEPVTYATRFIEGAVLDFIDGVDDDTKLPDRVSITNVPESRWNKYRSGARGSIASMPWALPRMSSLLSPVDESSLNPMHANSADEESMAESESTVYVLNKDQSFAVLQSEKSIRSPKPFSSSADSLNSHTMSTRSQSFFSQDSRRAISSKRTTLVTSGSSGDLNHGLEKELDNRIVSTNSSSPINPDNEECVVRPIDN